MASQVPRFEQLLANQLCPEAGDVASQVPRFEQLLALCGIMRRTFSLRRYRASSSYLPGALLVSLFRLLRRYRASSSYLPRAVPMVPRQALRRYRASSSYLPLAHAGGRDHGLRRYRASSSYLSPRWARFSPVSFAGTALRAVTCLNNCTIGGIGNFTGTVLGAVT